MRLDAVITGTHHLQMAWKFSEKSAGAVRSNEGKRTYKMATLLRFTKWPRNNGKPLSVYRLFILKTGITAQYFQLRKIMTIHVAQSSNTTYWQNACWVRLHDKPMLTQRWYLTAVSAWCVWAGDCSKSATTKIFYLKQYVHKLRYFIY